eukprot:9262196-Pyramimonas_sp.AAC.1
MGRCSECCPSPGRASPARRTTSRPISPSADRDLPDATAHLERSTTRALNVLLSGKLPRAKARREVPGHVE